MSADLLQQFAQAVYDDAAPAAITRLREAADGIYDIDRLLGLAKQYPTTEEVVEVLARRALALDPQSESAWEVLAAAYDLYDGQWLNERTRVALDRLLAVNPLNLTGLRITLLHAKDCEDFARALTAAESMLRVDPLNFAATAAKAKLIANAGNKEAALQLIDRYINSVERGAARDKIERLRLIRLRRADVESGNYLDGVWP